MDVTYEQVLSLADRLSPDKQLQLIADLSVRVREGLAFSLTPRPGKRGLMDVYGIWRGVVFNEDDFKAAEWHPT